MVVKALLTLSLFFYGKNYGGVLHSAFINLKQGGGYILIGYKILKKNNLTDSIEQWRTQNHIFGRHTV
jgi:hypothetical protein